MKDRLDELQRIAGSEGQTCLVGAVIRDEQGRVFVQRRSWDRRLWPGCWDIVGGHVEEGESLLEALAREIEEETGWTLSGVTELLAVSDWHTEETGKLREFDFLVEVDGDLAEPRLEAGKHLEHRWIGPDETALFEENRPADQGWLARIVELAFPRR